ncbi:MULTISPECIES: MFS transporter [Gordonibacter]|uniref:MFS transporter n=1 Tax=Gordonibacter faecis TaxID=3047475 RepID=A0ABT7DPU2_9ACTN|nr:MULTISPECIES: MFS transporter [unclassified Gordonibacter]MDJ1651561.1 MFS transporter [Gordonibacter sp. KGMB12511]HIW76983.1 MFS transporter [Candidatus Gordonibacter avicola]
MSEKTGSKFFTQGWIQVFIVFVVCIVTQGFGLYSFSMLRIPMTEMLGAEASVVSLGFSVYLVVSGVAGLAVNGLVSKIGIRGCLLIAAVMYSGGFLILGFVNSLWMVFVAYAVMGIGNGCGGLVLITAIPSNWFIKRRGIATGITLCATFPASLITTNLVAILTAAGSWQNAPMILALISFIVLLAAAFLIKFRPQDVGLYPDGMTKEEAARVENEETAGAVKVVGLNRSQAIKTFTFWAVIISFGLIGIGEQGVFQNFPTYIVSTGFDLATAGVFMTFLSIAGCVGKLLSGYFIDRIGPRITYVVVNVLAASGLMAIVFFGANVAVLYIGGFFFGAALSSAPVCFTSAVSKYLGPAYFAALYSIAFLAKTIMDAIGVPALAAVGSSGFGWNGALFVGAAFILVSAVFMLVGGKKSKLLSKMEEDAAKELAEEVETAKA